MIPSCLDVLLLFAKECGTGCVVLLGGLLVAEPLILYKHMNVLWRSLLRQPKGQKTLLAYSVCAASEISVCEAL